MKRKLERKRKEEREPGKGANQLRLSGLGGCCQSAQRAGGILDAATVLSLAVAWTPGSPWAPIKLQVCKAAESEEKGRRKKRERKRGKS
jgi:hypothetical protein